MVQCEIYTFPHCEKCDKVKKLLKEHNIEFIPYNLKDKMGIDHFREYILSVTILKDLLVRNKDGTLNLPIVLFWDNGETIALTQGVDDTKKYLEV